MADTAPKIYEVSEYKAAPGGRHVHHGRTAAAWAGSMISLVGFIVGAIGLIVGSWPIFWAGGVLLVISLIATVVLQKMGKGAA